MEILADKGFNDVLYCLLQVESNHTPGEKHRYIKKSAVDKKAWSKVMKMSVKTFNRRLKDLIDREVVIEQGDYYILPEEISKYYYMIPMDTMRFLCNTANQDVFKVYSHLGRWYENEGANAYFTKSKLITVLGGKSTTNPRDWEKINDILTCLKNNGLIEYVAEYELGKPNRVARYRLIKVSKTYNK